MRVANAASQTWRPLRFTKTGVPGNPRCVVEVVLVVVQVVVQLLFK